MMNPENNNLEQSEAVLVEKVQPDEKNDSPKLSPKSCDKLHRIFALLQEKDRLSNANKFLTSSGDMNLACIGYPTLLLSGIIRAIGETPHVRLILAYLARNMKEGPLKRRFMNPVRLANRLRTLYSLTSDIRTFLRLWATLDYVEWAIASIKSPSDDKVLRYVDYLQVFSCSWYQLLENIAYLGSHRVLPMSGKTESRLWSVSCIMWAIHVQLDFVKLFRQRHLYGEDPAWKRTLAKNCCYVPLSIHWSMEKGFLPDIVVGLMGTFTAYTSAVPKWRALLV